MSATNRDLVNQAIAAIPQWIAFLNQKEAEQDALLAEVRLDKKERKGALSALTSRFKRQPKSESDSLPNVDENEQLLTSREDSFARNLMALCRT